MFLPEYIFENWIHEIHQNKRKQLHCQHFLCSKVYPEHDIRIQKIISMILHQILSEYHGFIDNAKLGIM